MVISHNQSLGNELLLLSRQTAGLPGFLRINTDHIIIQRVFLCLHRFLQTVIPKTGNPVRNIYLIRLQIAADKIHLLLLQAHIRKIIVDFLHGKLVSIGLCNSQQFTDCLQKICLICHL